MEATKEPILTTRQLRYLVWLGVVLVLSLAVRFGLWPPAGAVVVPLPSAPPEFLQQPSDAATNGRTVTLTSPELVRAGVRSVGVVFPAGGGGGDQQPPTPPAGSRSRTVDQIRAAVGTVKFASGGMCSGQFVDLSHEGEESWTLPDGTGLIANAAHCGRVGQEAVFQLPDGRAFACVVVAANTNADAAWLRTKGRVAGVVPTVVLAPQSPPVNTEVWHCGHGWDNPRSIEFGRVRSAQLPDGKITVFLNLSQGDSGGGFFRRDNNELFSTACCTTRIAQAADSFGPSTESLRALMPQAKAARVRSYGVPLCEDVEKKNAAPPVEMPKK